MSLNSSNLFNINVVPYIGTWIETLFGTIERIGETRRTLYRYVD